MLEKRKYTNLINLDESVPLTPTIANSLLYRSSNDVIVFIINNPKREWQILETTYYENKLNEFNNWTLRKTYLIQNKEQKLDLIRYQKFDSKERIYKVNQENTGLLEIKK